jgi:hypothetical protein
MTNEIKLLPCPLCGCAEINLLGYANADGQFVQCTDCHVSVDVLKDMTPWNLRAAPVSVVPDGWKLVPIQPTNEMLKAVDDEVDDKHLARGRAISAWSQMLDATPEPSVADIEPFAVIGDYAACGGNQTVFTPEYAELITDRMCSKTAVYTLGAVGAAVAAINTLNAKGYTYHGAALWKPPIGETMLEGAVDE